ncbi:TetR/AcrR family transcriptional regulator [Maricaulis maris]|uniref:TetR family transcriptional regulator n=1 Tax=Maricaulis maris TaxID=74318 RepID=A0A495CW45_9PROT|nr:TetR/AcrR family transcriptional regulator [Maricaulis maris]RKQ89598.1 TetR family transcriptional regulator [Maricaulis maris]
MPASRGVGRPQKGTQTLAKDQILSAALLRMRQGGLEAISFRRLANALGVSPMAIKYHVGGQQDLLAALVELAFKGTLAVDEDRKSTKRLKHILSLYCARALDNANLVRCILGDPSLMSNEIVAITEEIRKNTRLLNDGDPNDVMLNLLVDYTHGFVFAAAAAKNGKGPTLEDFLRSIEWVIGADLPGKNAE